MACFRRDTQVTKMRFKPVVLVAQIFLLFIIAPFHAFAIMRCIDVRDSQGKAISLYRDYQELVIGISDYERWPKLPDAVNDANEVASRLRMGTLLRF